MAEEKQGNENVVFIGTKPFMNYVASIMMQFRNDKRKEVIIKARGKLISRAVDVAEIVRKKFSSEEDIKIKDVKIGGEELENKEGRKTHVSTIEIVLIK
jgi:DNA-binding protein